PLSLSSILILSFSIPLFLSLCLPLSIFFYSIFISLSLPHHSSNPIATRQASMTSLVRPLEIFTKAATRSSCVWLDALTSHTGERPCWEWMWNDAVNRISNEDSAIRIIDRVRQKKLRSPSLICGDISRLDEATKKFYTDEKCHFTQASDEWRTRLAAILENIAQMEPLAGTGVRPPSTLILGGLSGRIDRTMATLHSLMPTHSNALAAPSFVLDGENLVCVLPKGTHRLQMGPRTQLTDICGIIPLSQDETRVTTKGFRWDLKDALLAFGHIISTSNELAKDEVEITTSAPVLFSIELLNSLTGLKKPPSE
ncbi:hypothetical protein PMAYCL1PPCAC_05058, partial [Pristionchus mayeri]